MYLYTFYEAVLGGGDSRIHKLKEVRADHQLANQQRWIGGILSHQRLCQHFDCWILADSEDEMEEMRAALETSIQRSLAQVALPTPQPLGVIVCIGITR